MLICHSVKALLASDMPCSLKASHAPNVAASTASETLARVSRMQRAIASAETAADISAMLICHSVKDFMERCHTLLQSLVQALQPSKPTSA